MELVGQQPYQSYQATVDSRVQTEPELLETADAGEPSSPADAAALCRAVRGDGGGGGGRGDLWMASHSKSLSTDL